LGSKNQILWVNVDVGILSVLRKWSIGGSCHKTQTARWFC
jgi:hypothetical protein